MRLEKSLKDGLPPVRLIKSLRSKRAVSESPVSRLSISMYRWYLPKKAQSINIDGDVYSTKIESFTHKKVYDVIVSKKFLNENDRVLIIDDFLANGCALAGLIDLVQSAGAVIEGIGIVVEKGFQNGGDLIRSKGVRLESLAIIDGMNDETGEITFRD